MNERRHASIAGPNVDLAQTYLGMAVRAGAPKPDISSVDAFKQTLLRAKSVTFDSRTTGIYLTATLKRLIAFLASEGATAAIKKNGMEPSRPR